MAGSKDWQSFYVQEAGRYEAARYGSAYGAAFRSAHRAVVNQLLDRVGRVGYAADVASGTGQLLPCLLERADCVMGCDLTREMLLVAKTSLATSTASFVQADSFHLPFRRGTLDVLVSSRFLHLFPIEQQREVLLEFRRVLRPGGWLVVDFYNRRSRMLLAPLINIYRRLARKRPEHDVHLTPHQASRLLAEAGFEPVATRGVGSYFIVPLLWLPHAWIARLMRGQVFANAWMAEQWIVAARA